MPALPFRTMPGAQQVEEPMRQGVQAQDPVRRVESQYNQQRQYLHRQWKIDAEAIDNTWFADRGKWQTAVAKLTAKYRKEELKLQQVHEQQQQQQQQKQQYIMGLRGRGKALTDVELYQAQRRLTGEEERFARLPVEQKPFTFTQLSSLGKFIQATAERAKEEPWKLGKKRTRKSLIDQYLFAIDTLRIEDPVFGITKQQQFNEMWNRVMSTDKNFANWFDKQGKPPVEMRVVGAKGRIADAMKDKLIGKSPIGRSLLEKTYGTRKQMAERYGFREPTPQRQMPRPTSQAEYNRIPSGTQYIGTDGQIRTKR